MFIIPVSILQYMQYIHTPSSMLYTLQSTKHNPHPNILISNPLYS